MVDYMFSLFYFLVSLPLFRQFITCVAFLYLSLFYLEVIKKIFEVNRLRAYLEVTRVSLVIRAIKKVDELIVSFKETYLYIGPTVFLLHDATNNIKML